LTPRPTDDDDVLNEDWIKCRMVRSYRLLSLVLVAIGVMSVDRWTHTNA
jgi:hypothetical protein